MMNRSEMEDWERGELATAWSSKEFLPKGLFAKRERERGIPRASVFTNPFISG